MENMAATHVIVPYKTKSQRATETASHAAAGLLIAMVPIVAPLLIKYLNDGHFTRGSFVTLLAAAGSAALGVVMTWVVKYYTAADLKPTIAMVAATETATAPEAPEVPEVPAAPSFQRPTQPRA